MNTKIIKEPIHYLPYHDADSLMHWNLEKKIGEERNQADVKLKKYHKTGTRGK